MKEEIHFADKQSDESLRRKGNNGKKRQKADKHSGSIVCPGPVNKAECRKRVCVRRGMAGRK